jgi:hypothetical protein
MTETTASTNVADRLPDSVYLHILDTLRTTLPEPPSNDPEQLESAIAEVGSFSPANAAEARLAARYVAFSAYADHCLHLARQMESKGQLEWVTKCLAQANATSRQASGQLSLLLRLQKERCKLENGAHALNRAAWAEHIAIARMTDALGGRPAPEPITEPLPPPPAPEPTPEPPAPMATAQPPVPEHEPDESPPLSDAVYYAVMYPERAALIRRLGRVPDDVTFDPPDDDLVQELLATQDPVVTLLDERFAHNQE